MRILKSFKRDFIITAIMFIVLGIIFLAFPKSSGKIICYIFAAILCLLGIMRIIGYFSNQVSMSNYSLGLVVGVIAVGFGIYIFAKPEVLIDVLTSAFGIIILIDAIIKLQNTIDMFRLGEERWWIMLVVTAITALLGSIMLIKSDVMLQFVGIALVLTGLLDIFDIITLSSIISGNSNPDDFIEILQNKRDNNDN